jgi:hypothetical protein
MALGAAVAKEKKTGEKPAEDERVTEPVKLRPTFKKRLQRVAEDAGVEMGILIERKMAEFINREFQRLLEADLRELRGGSA